MIRLQKADENTNADEKPQEINGLDSIDSSLDIAEGSPSSEVDLNIDLDTPIDVGDTEQPTGQNNLNSFSQSVLSQIIQRDILPIPSNYQTFFDQMLDKESLDFQKKIHDLIETEGGSDDRNIVFEKNIQTAFHNTKEILKCTSLIYKHLTLMNDINKRWCGDLRRGNSEESKHLKELDAVQKTIDKHNRELKILYNNGNKILDNINTSSMYDTKFDVYNKRYFIQLVQDELKSVQKFGHVSTILMMTIPHSVTKHLRNDKMALIVMKTIAKLLLKTSRRSDMIGYIGNGIFGMLLKHSDVFASKKASERLIELLNNTNIFVGDNEIKLDLKIGISKIIPTRSAETSLNYAIGALRSVQMSESSYIVYKEDDE